MSIGARGSPREISVWPSFSHIFTHEVPWLSLIVVISPGLFWQEVPWGYSQREWMCPCSTFFPIVLPTCSKYAAGEHYCCWAIASSFPCCSVVSVSQTWGWFTCKVKMAAAVTALAEWQRVWRSRCLLSDLKIWMWLQSSKVHPSLLAALSQKWLKYKHVTILILVYSNFSKKYSYA